MRNLPALTNTRGRFSGEYKYIEDVVRIRYPIRAARTYLRRNLGNTIHIHLVEVERGEDVGNIRRAEVISADGAPTVEINVLRTLPDDRVCLPG